MAELTPSRSGSPAPKKVPARKRAVASTSADASSSVERELRARIAELEAIVEARTQVIVAMGARLAELHGDPPPALAQRLREAERRLAELESTKVLRWSALPRRLYAKLRRNLHA
jgi:hypothetical protein